MLRITCPYCGVRDEPEFVFGGSTHIERPPAAVDDATWAEFLFVRDNPAGLHFERWSHAFGCGRWFNVARNTLTHEILATYPMGAPRPDLSVN
jgi:sarcosine oxidase subunit delta